ncbi:MAG: sugar transferase [Bacteroidales bacterium]|nr:sugar transferase [Bacteroidales bacterium]
MKKRTLYYIIADILVVTAAFMFFIWIKPASKRYYLPEYYEPFLFFLFIWVSVSVAIDKYRLHKKKDYKDVLFPIIAGDLIILATVVALIYGFQQFQYSRMIVFGTMAVSFAMEFLLGYLFFTGIKLRKDADHFEEFRRATQKAIKDQLKLVESDEILQAKIDASVPPLNKELVIEKAGEKVFDYIEKQIKLEHMYTLLVATSTRFNIENQPQHYYNAIVNLKRLNDIQRINKFLEKINEKLPHQGIFIGCVQTNVLVKKRIMKQFPPGLNLLFYIPYFTWKRVFPKLPVIKNIYFFVTKGRNRAISRAETFGRLYSCGFEVVNHQQINGYIYFTARKILEPSYDYHPTYGPLIRLKRIGKNGKTIYVYKMRTMHPYSEYLQQYVYDQNKLQEGGKFKNDFRVHTAGRFMRRFWIDEMPMLFNLLKGDLKPVGVRPLSRHYFDLYDEDLKEKRIKTRPGLIPPFYADMPQTLEEIQASEHQYLDAYFKRPFITDCRYFWMAIYNIIFKKARSK